MVEIIISTKSIAIIFGILNDNKIKEWKIAFGKETKKILPFKSIYLKSAIKEVRRLGFGGYHIVQQIASERQLEKELFVKSKLKMFSDEKNWFAIYKEYHENNSD